MIKLLGYLLMTAGLIGGSLAAITMYRPRTSLPDGALIGLTLSAPAGVTEGEPHTPLVARGEVLTAENLAAIRASGEARIVVKEFALARWDMAWVAGVAIGTLGVGAFLVKSQVRREIRAAARASASDTSRGPTPEAALETIRVTLDRLRTELVGVSDDEAKNARILEVIGGLNAVEVAAIVDQRNTILGRLGMGGLANFMDRFASAERAMNRAWSAAADGITEEAELCLARAIETVPEAQARLKGA
jgi:hypothetical protein